MQKVKRTALYAALGVCAGAAILPAPARANDAYIRGEVLGGFAGQYEDVTNGKLDSSILYGGALGTRVSPHVRLEAEYMHAGADFARGGGDTHANLAMANAYYDFTGYGGRHALTPFVGGGIGYGWYDPTGGSDSAVTYQAIGGVSKELSRNLTGEISYKYVAAPDLTIAGTDTGYHSSYLGAGVRLKLGR